MIILSWILTYDQQHQAKDQSKRDFDTFVKISLAITFKLQKCMGMLNQWCETAVVTWNKDQIEIPAPNGGYILKGHTQGQLQGAIILPFRWVRERR